MSSENRIPDGIEPVIAARSWNFAPPGLTSITQDVRWGREGLAAECKQGWPDQHTDGTVCEAPCWGCTCGIYALSNHEASAMVNYGDLVRGTVEMWGRIICGSNGWRAQYARVSGIHPAAVAAHTAETVAAFYGVPVLDDWPELTPPYTEEENSEHRQGEERNHYRADTGYGSGNYLTSAFTIPNLPATFFAPSTPGVYSIAGTGARIIVSPSGALYYTLSQPMSNQIKSYASLANLQAAMKALDDETERQIDEKRTGDDS